MPGRTPHRWFFSAWLLAAPAAFACSPTSYLEGDPEIVFAQFFTSPMRQAHDLSARGEVSQGPHDVHLRFKSAHPVTLRLAEAYRPCDPKEESKTFKRHFPFSRAVLAHSETLDCKMLTTKTALVTGERVLLYDKESTTYFFRSWLTAAE